MVTNSTYKIVNNTALSLGHESSRAEHMVGLTRSLKVGAFNERVRPTSVLSGTLCMSHHTSRNCHKFVPLDSLKRKYFPDLDFVSPILYYSLRMVFQ